MNYLSKKYLYLCKMKLQLDRTAFWDIDMGQLDEVRNADFIIARIFQYGLLADIKTIIKHYNKDTINHALTTTRGIDPKAIALGKALGYLE